jgi:TRAP-type C4-dicarboxylate transport system permease small subunit
LRLDNIGLFMGAMSCAALFILVMGDIILRQVNIPFYLSIEYTGFLVAFVSFFPLGDITRRQSHLAADFFINLLGASARRFIQRYVIRASVALYAVVLAWVAVQVLATSVGSDLRSVGPLRTPMALPQAAMVVAVLGMLLRALASLFGVEYTSEDAHHRGDAAGA